jgi:hypothetical protein
LKVQGTTQLYKSLYQDCDASNTFGGRSLPVHDGKMAKCSTDKNRVDYLNILPGGIVSFSAKGSVDADGSKFACGDKWPNQCGTWLQFDAGSDRKDVNAEDTPFVVVPGRTPDRQINFQKDTGINAGDLAVAIKGDKCSFGVVGDSGPWFRIGELSLRAHADLGNPQCNVANQYPCTSIKDRGLEAPVYYLIFPKTRPAPLTNQNVNSIAESTLEKRIKALLEAIAH